MPNRVRIKRHLSRILAWATGPVQAGPLDLFLVLFALLLLTRLVVDFALLMPWEAFPGGFRVGFYNNIGSYSSEPADYVAINLFAWSESILWKLTLVITYGGVLLKMLVARPSRLSLGAVFLLTVSYSHEFPVILNGGDQLLLCFAFWLLVLPETPVTSRPSRSQIPRLTILVLQAQVALVYAATGLHKLCSSEWLHGEAINLALTTPFVRSWASGLQVPHSVSILLSYATLCFELSFPVGVFVRRARPLYLMCGILFHVVIEATLRLSMFSWIMVASYALFSEPECAERFLVRFRGTSPSPEGRIPVRAQ